jgi:glutamate synthase (NADPH/NADH) large chain
LLTAAYGYNPAQEMDSAASAWSWRWTAAAAATWSWPARRAEGGDRGAVDADGKIGDGAGLHVEIPQDFFRDYPI